MELKDKVTISRFVSGSATTTGNTLTRESATAEYHLYASGVGYAAAPSRRTLKCALGIVLGREPKSDELDYAAAEWRDVYGMAVARLRV